MSGSEAPRPKVRIGLLGSFSASDGSRDLSSALAQPRRVALVALLALTRPWGLHRRDSLCTMLWPESPDDRARAALRQLLLVLRRELGEDAFVTQGDLVGLNRDRIEIDAGVVFDALEAGDDAVAVEQCSGELLPGFHLPDSEPFEGWFGGRRRELQQGVRGAAWRLVDRAEAGGDMGVARQAAERAMALDADNEQGLRRLLTLQARSGDRGAALRTAEEFQRKLRQDWDTVPDEATRSLLERIRAGDLAPIPAEMAVRSGPASAEIVTAPASVAPDGPPERRVRRSLRLASLAVLALVAAAALGVWRRGRVDARIRPDRVLVAAFDNLTRDSSVDALGAVAADWLATGLLQSGVGEVVDPVTSYFAARGVGAAGNRTIGREHVRALAEAGGAGLVVTGSIRSEQDSVVFQLQVSDGGAARLVGAFRVAVPSADAATAGVEEVRAIVGGFIAARLDPRVSALRSAGLPPPRLEAYQRFVRGLDHFAPQRYRDALPHFLEAARLDTNFVTPVIWAHYAARNGGNSAAADSLQRVARDLLRSRGTRLSSLERYGLEALVAPDPVALRSALAAAARLAPGSDYAYRLARMYPFDYRRSIALYEGIDRRWGWARDWPHLYADYGKVLHLAGDNARAAELMQEAVGRGVEDPELRTVQAMALAAAGRPGDVGPVIDALEALPRDPEFLPALTMALVAGELRRVGLASDGDRMLQRARDWTASHRGELSVRDHARCLAWISSFSGQWDDAITSFEQVRSDPPPSARIVDFYDRYRVATLAAYRHRDTLVRGATAFVDAFDGEPDLSLRAMVLAVSGESAQAVRMIRESVARDWWSNRNQELLMHDPSFARFRESAAWREFLAGRQ